MMTIGMAVYNDYSGVYFTVQSLRLALLNPAFNYEIIIVDNFGCQRTRQFANNIDCRYLLYTDVIGTAQPRNLIFQEARGDFVLCLDSHVLLAPGALERLYQYCQIHPYT